MTSSLPLTELLIPGAPFRQLADRVPFLLWAARADGAGFYRNQAWLDFCGRAFEAELGEGWLDSVHPDDRDRVRAAWTAVIPGGQPFHLEYRLRRADGHYRRVSDHGVPWTGRDGCPDGALGAAADVTDEAGGDPAAGSRNGGFRALLENARDMTYRIALLPARRIEFVGGSVEAITGRTAEEFYATPGLTRDSLHPDDLPVFDRLMSEPGAAAATVVLRWVHPDGRVVSAEHRRVPVYDRLGRQIAIEGMVRDVTSVLENQQRLRDSEEQMRQLAAHVQTAREEERGRVARELHDEVGQTLTALKLEIGRVQAELSAQQMTPTLIDRMQSLIGLSDIGLGIVKRIATNLRPPTLDHLGLAEAIHWEARTFKARTGIRCHLRANKRRSALTAEQQTALFRIFQEALTNVVRHAQASAVNVSLTERGPHAELRISDNGRGISDGQAANPRALGLLGMRERAALVGGDFRIVGRAGRGTVVTVLVPVAAPRPRPRAPRAVRAKQVAR